MARVLAGCVFTEISTSLSKRWSFPQPLLSNRSVLAQFLGTSCETGCSCWVYVDVGTRIMYTSQKPNHEFATLLVGFAAGVLGTLIFATYKQREFDRLVGKSREMAGSTQEFFEDFEGNARSTTHELANAAHRGVNKVDRAAHNAIDSVKQKVLNES